MRPLTPEPGYAFAQHNTGIRRYDKVILPAAPPVVVMHQQKGKTTHNAHAANRVCVRKRQEAAVFFEELVKLASNCPTCIEKIKSLLKGNEDSLQQGYVSFVNGLAYTVLHYLADQGVTELVQYLIEDLQIDPDMGNGDAKVTALQYAAYQGHLDT
ncbi:MAG: ankyrin repeat domain-containing protein, partial [Bacteroidota bacterium]